MKIIRVERLIDAGRFSQTKRWKTAMGHIESAIQTIEWPEGSGSFTLYPERKGNGVKPIKRPFIDYLSKSGWTPEQPFDIATLKRPGGIDACYPVGRRYFAVEWETGNISSSHRAVNKMALGILKNILIGGLLILPNREMYQYLTDRIGNFSELEPYFPLWKALNVKEGFLGVMAIEHDGVSADVPRIPKGTDGRALA